MGELVKVKIAEYDREILITKELYERLTKEGLIK